MIEELKNYTYQEAGILLGGISAATVQRMVRDGTLTGKRIGQTLKADGNLSRGKPRIPGWAIIQYNLAGATEVPTLPRRQTWQTSSSGEKVSTGGAVSKRQAATRLAEALAFQQKKLSEKKLSLQPIR